MNIKKGKPMAEKTQGLSDEQVEELLSALMDFRQMLLGLTDRFQSRLALLEEEFETRRAAPAQLSTAIPQAGLRASRSPTAKLGALPDSPFQEPAAAEPTQETDIFDDEEAFEPDETEAFAIVDFDDDDDF